MKRVSLVKNAGVALIISLLGFFIDDEDDEEDDEEDDYHTDDDEDDSDDNNDGEGDKDDDNDDERDNDFIGVSGARYDETDTNFVERYLLIIGERAL